MFDAWDNKEKRIIKGHELDRLGLMVDCHGRAWKTGEKMGHGEIIIYPIKVTTRYGILRKVPCG